MARRQLGVREVGIGTRSPISIDRGRAPDEWSTGEAAA
jgi:hypothetical protein